MLQADDRVHFTHLKAFADSPAHYRTSVEEGFESPTFFFGRLVHYLTLGGVEGRDFVVWEEGDRRGKAWAAFKEANEGRDIYKRSEVEEASRLAAAVRRDPVVLELGLLEGEHELLIDWDNCGVPFRSHVDITGVPYTGKRKGRRHLCDLKIAQSAKPSRFSWAARAYFYHAQLATYADALRSMRLAPDDVYLIGVERDAPHCVTVLELTPAILEEGRQIARKWLEQYRLCAATGEWPGYVQAPVLLDVLPTLDEDKPIVLTMHDGSEVAA